MARIRWRGGKDFRHMVKEMLEFKAKLYADAEEALAASLIEGALTLQDLLEAAETETGRRRAKKGGSPGRHRSGNMIASVTHNADKLVVSGGKRDGAYGWFPGEYEDYFRLQDLGSKTPVEWPDRPGLLTTIPAAMAMSDSFGYAREDFIRRMTELVRGR
jgi:hypothetical protein